MYPWFKRCCRTKVYYYHYYLITSVWLTFSQKNWKWQKNPGTSINQGTYWFVLASLFSLQEDRKKEKRVIISQPGPFHSVIHSTACMKLTWPLFFSSLHIYPERIPTLPPVCRTWCRPAGERGWRRRSGAQSLSRCSPGRSLCSGGSQAGRRPRPPPGSPNPSGEEVETVPAESGRTRERKGF